MNGFRPESKKRTTQGHECVNKGKISVEKIDPRTRVAGPRPNKVDLNYYQHVH